MYEIVYHRLVLSKDFKKIPAGSQGKILRVIEKKLAANPEVFGKPLHAELKGYYRLRVDLYRIIYRIEKQQVIVYIMHIGLRKDFLVYLETARRLGLM